ncbi:hypothetical protein B484DRAFT_432095 [Ochromonadaceae sp. CCMP2298]|nr:hypothetical protein B484DRAFT_432095 [Ochromonadaceae sp. CCMP2298]
MTHKNHPDGLHNHVSCYTGTFACKAHVNCEHKTRLWTTSNGDWWVQTCGLHKVVAATGGSSLTPFVKNKITELSKVGAKPRAIQALLSKSLPQELVPGLTQIHNIKARISAEVVPVTSHADLLVRLAELSVERMSNPEDQSTWPSPSTVIVVSIWNSGLLPPSMAVVPRACAQGFAIMSTAILSKPGNVDKHKSKLHKLALQDIKADIWRLHLSRTKESQEALTRATLYKWRAAGDVEFAKYFKKQYLTGRWVNWTLPLMPKGTPATDNPLESFNTHGIKEVVRGNYAPVGTWLEREGGLSKVLHEVAAMYSTLGSKCVVPNLCQLDSVNFNPPCPATLEKALNMLQEGHVRKVRAAGEVVGYLVCKEKITTSQCSQYLQSLRGFPGREPTVSDFSQIEKIHFVCILPSAWTDPLASLAPDDTPGEALIGRRVATDGRRFGRSTTLLPGTGEYGIVTAAAPGTVFIRYQDDTTAQTTPAAARLQLLSVPEYYLCCDCKSQHLTRYLCSHSVVGMHWQGLFDIRKAAARVNFRRRRRRPTNKDGALSRQTPFSQPLVAEPLREDEGGDIFMDVCLAEYAEEPATDTARNLMDGPSSESVSVSVPSLPVVQAEAEAGVGAAEAGAVVGTEAVTTETGAVMGAEAAVRAAEWRCDACLADRQAKAAVVGTGKRIR